MHYYSWRAWFLIPFDFWRLSGKRDPGQNLSKDSACGKDLLRERYLYHRCNHSRLLQTGNRCHHIQIKKQFTETSLVVWWLRFHNPNTRGPSSIPGQETRSPYVTTKTGRAKWIIKQKTIVHSQHPRTSLEFSSSHYPYKGSYHLEQQRLVLPVVVLWSEVKWKSLSRVQLFVTPWTIQFMDFSRPEYWSG